MKKVTVAFDVDGTLRSSSVDQKKPPVANEDIRTLLVILSKFKNVDIIVWSGGGELYARQVCSSLGLSKYVDRYVDKEYAENPFITGRHVFKTEVRPDIAIDDIHSFSLGHFNLICREK